MCVCVCKGEGERGRGGSLLKVRWGVRKAGELGRGGVTLTESRC